MPQRGIIPSGSAPLAFGNLTTDGLGMAEKITQRMMEKYKFDRTQAASEKKSELARQAKEREDLIGALSFDTVEGMTDKIKKIHMQEVEGVHNKYAEILAKKGKFDTEDYLDIERDKMRINQKISNYKHNTKRYSEIIDFVRENPNAVNPKTLENIAAYNAKGEMGPTDDIVVPWFNTFSYLDDAIKLSDIKGEEIIEDWDGKNDYLTKVQSKERGLTEAVERLLQGDPVLKERLKDPVERPVILQQAHDWMQSKIAATTGRKQEIVPDYLRKAHKEKQIEQSQESPYVKSMLKKGLKKDESVGMERAHSLAYRFANADKEAVAEVKARPEVQEVQVKDKSLIVTLNRGKVGERGENVTVEIQRGNFEKEFEKIYTEILPDTYKPVQNKEVYKYFDPKYKTEISEKQEIAEISAIREKLAKGDEMSNSDKNDITDALQSILGDKFERETGWFTKGTFKIKGDDGKYKLYSIKNPEHMKELEKLMDERLKEIKGETGGEKPGVEFSEEQESVISKLMEQNAGWTREEIIKELGY